MLFLVVFSYHFGEQHGEFAWINLKLNGNSLDKKKSMVRIYPLYQANTFYEWDVIKQLKANLKNKIV